MQEYMSLAGRPAPVLLSFAFALFAVAAAAAAEFSFFLPGVRRVDRLFLLPGLLLLGVVDEDLNNPPRNYVELAPDVAFEDDPVLGEVNTSLELRRAKRGAFSMEDERNEREKRIELGRLVQQWM